MGSLKVGDLDNLFKNQFWKKIKIKVKISSGMQLEKTWMHNRQNKEEKLFKRRAFMEIQACP